LLIYPLKEVKMIETRINLVIGKNFKNKKKEKTYPQSKPEEDARMIREFFKNKKDKK